MEELQPVKKDRLTKHYTLGAVVSLLIIASFVAGVFLGELRLKIDASATGAPKVTGKEQPPPYMLKDVDFAQFWETWKTVKERYVVQPVSDVDLFYGAMEGMVDALKDPYSVYFNPEFAKKFNDELSGTFEGIGAEIGIKDEKVTVIAPLQDKPAMKAGLRAGDWIVSIDGAETGGMGIEEAVSKIRGPKGTVVKLLIMRKDLKEPQEFAITRATIIVESVKWEMKTVKGKKIAHITISHFNDTTESEFNDAVRNALLESPAGLVLDLRNNPGGFLDTAVKVTGEWTPNQTVTIEKFSDGKEQNYNASSGGRLSDMPTVVLVNGGSASASEIVAGALKDYGKATIVGETTYGKGSVQDYLEYGDGSALKITIALWLTPKGTSIDKQGITPDIEVKMTPEDFNAEKDPQLDKAVQLLIAPPAAPAPVKEGGPL